MTYPDAIDYLYGLQKYGIKLGIEKTGNILSALGNPHRGFKSIHVAGTNGKGSVSAMICSILMSHGFKVGLFTSPHLVSFTERIRIDNEEIRETDVASIAEEMRAEIRKIKPEIPEPTFFEFITAMAFLYFYRNNIDWAVVETGMGGRLDATNTLIPEVSVITRISYDHKEFLGSTLSGIAGEKAGIIKKGIPSVCAMQEKEADRVIRKTAETKSSQLYIYGEDFSGDMESSGLDGITFSYHNGKMTVPGLRVPLAGDHQLSNACIAIKASLLAMEGSDASGVVRQAFHEKKESENALRSTHHASRIREGLASTSWRGRLEILNSKPQIMIDGAHNPDAAAALASFIKKHLKGFRIILVIGLMSDKDIPGILAQLLPAASEIIFTAPDYGRAAPPQKLSEHAAAMGFASTNADTVKDAIGIAIKSGSKSKDSGADNKDSALILITGSFYVIGEALEALGEKAVLGSLRETL